MNSIRKFFESESLQHVSVRNEESRCGCKDKSNVENKNESGDQ